MTAALANHSQGETGMKRRRSGSLTPYSNFSPAFWPQWDLCSLDPSTLCWSISPLWHHFLSCWARTTWCIIPTSFLSAPSNSSTLCLQPHTPANLQLQIPPVIHFCYTYTKTAKHSWGESHNSTDWCHGRFMFSDLSWILNTISQPVLGQLPFTFPSRAHSPHADDLTSHPERNEAVSVSVWPSSCWTRNGDGLSGQQTTGLRWSRGREAPSLQDQYLSCGPYSWPTKNWCLKCLLLSLPSFSPPTHSLIRQCSFYFPFLTTIIIPEISYDMKAPNQI